MDYGRLIAAIGIIWFHAEAPGYRLAYAALPFFLVFLSRPSRSSQSERVQRLLRLYVVWCAIYAIAWIGVAHYYGLDIFVWWRPWMIVAGTSIHLWFLPFAMAVALAAPALRASKATVVMPILAALTLAYLGETRAFPYYQWALGIIPVLVGFAYFHNRRLAVLALIVSYLVLEAFRPSPDNAIIFLGSGLALCAFSVSMPATWLSEWCVRISLWVYLNHMLVIFLVESPKWTGAALAVVTAFFSIVLAVAIELAVRRVKRPAA